MFSSDYLFCHKATFEFVNSIFEKSSESKQKSAASSIRLTDVSKSFKRTTQASKGYSTIKSSLINSLLRKSSSIENTLVALDEVNLNVERGESVGVIGRNGSGKSTILKLIAGIYQPDSGLVEVNGRVSALIELGAGFHPDFSGRENLVLGGIMYGLSRKEIEERIPEIIDYAELKDFIDDPVRTYSSGMYMRLGFSLAVHTDPDVLLVDEVLAVGDAAFTKRCQSTIGDLKRKGTTMLLVTHDLDSVERWCDRAVWLYSGKVQSEGAPRRVIDSYLMTLDEQHQERLKKENDSNSLGDQEGEVVSVGEDESLQPTDGPGRWGNKAVEVTDVVLKGEAGSSTWVLKDSQELTVEISYRINSAIDSLVIGVGLLKPDGTVVHGTNTDIEDLKIPVVAEDGPFPAEGVLRYKLERVGLTGGEYFLDIAAHARDGLPFDYHHLLHKFSVSGGEKLHGFLSPARSWDVEVSYQTEQDSLKSAGGVS